MPGQLQPVRQRRPQACCEFANGSSCREGQQAVTNVMRMPERTVSLSVKKSEIMLPMTRPASPHRVEAQDALQVEHCGTGASCRLAPAEIDLAKASYVGDELRAAVGEGRAVVADMTRTVFSESSGFRALALALRQRPPPTLR
jgi:hypothetical protein